MSFIIILACVLIFSILFIFTITSLSTNKKGKQTKHNPDNIDISKQRNYFLQLEREIQLKEQELEQLKLTISNFSNRSTNNLPVIVEDVLNQYDINGVVLNADIYEELSYRAFTNEEQVFKFIEAQRQNWKLNSSKKFVKGIM